MDDKHTLVTYSLEGLDFAIPLHAVRQTIRMVEILPIPFASDTVMGLINYYGEAVPVINMRNVFKLQEREPDLADQIIIVRTERRTLGLWVDEVSGIYEALKDDILKAEKYMFPGEVKRKELNGCVRIQEGLLVIHNLEHLISASDEALLNDYAE